MSTKNQTPTNNEQTTSKSKPVTLREVVGEDDYIDDEPKNLKG